YWAFIPAPPPPDIAYTPGLALALSRADAALSELSGLGRHLPNPKMLIVPYVRREAVLSSRIEGTKAGVTELYLDEIEAPVSGGNAADVLEVRNYVTALDYGVKRLGKLPLSLRLVKELHEKLMKGVHGGFATPGEFRRSQNWIGGAGSTPTTATYVPPPPDRLMDTLGAWEKFLHLRDAMPDLVQCAIMHEHFEAIHPFLDGNGRVGRLLITLFLMERERLSHPLLYLSAYIESTRLEYYERLQAVRMHGDWNGWLMYFLEGVQQTATEGVKRAGRLMALRESTRAKLKGKPQATALLDELFINPYVTVARAAKLLHVTLPTARSAIGVLERARMVEESTGRDWGKVYVAMPILRIVENAVQ
ncbi:MAG: Fic family protein, partial [Planctomycetes bacterium]|nr:Fic family protein [Planctomycetota bacterium]